jgi:hypothetical protein
MIIRAGARSYIGTLRSGGKETARRAPKHSMKTLLGRSAFFAISNASLAIWHGSHDRFGALRMKVFHTLRSGDGRIMGVAFAVNKDIPA